MTSSLGKTTIADAVVSKIAGIAAREVSGVYDTGGGASRAVGALPGRIPGATVDHSQGVSVGVGEKQAAGHAGAVTRVFFGQGDVRMSVPDDADVIAATVAAVPGVAALHAGMFGEAAMYPPGHPVPGIRANADGGTVAAAS